MKRILITGATGNIGVEVIKYLIGSDHPNKVVAGVRDIDRAKIVLNKFDELEYAYFDFENPDSFDVALNSIDCIFLLRPPHLAEVDKYFKPLINCLKAKQIKEIVFLSVQGAEKSKVIPHNKIERLIIESGLDYIFLRPSYFIQNLTTTLWGDIKAQRKIILPSGKAKFNWIDIENIGEASSILIERFSEFQNQKIEITGYENENFFRVADLINSSIENTIEFLNVNPLTFYRIKKKEGMDKGMIMVMILLHYLPRFQKEPVISNFYEELTGKEPTRLIEFIHREKAKFDQLNYD